MLVQTLAACKHDTTWRARTTPAGRAAGTGTAAGTLSGTGTTAGTSPGTWTAAGTSPGTRTAAAGTEADAQSGTTGTVAAAAGTAGQVKTLLQVPRTMSQRAADMYLQAHPAGFSPRKPGPEPSVKIVGKKSVGKKYHKKCHKEKHSELIIYSNNCDGLNKKKESLKAELKRTKASIFTLQETHLPKRVRFI